MRYSDIIYDFYGIYVSKKQYDLIDAHFLAAAHHRVRAYKADSEEALLFHEILYFKHVDKMFSIISKGDFTRIIKDHAPTKKLGLDKREGWIFKSPVLLPLKDINQIDLILPDPEIFSDFLCADRRYLQLDNHPYDVLLNCPFFPISQIVLDVAVA